MNCLVPICLHYKTAMCCLIQLSGSSLQEGVVLDNTNSKFQRNIGRHNIIEFEQYTHAYRSSICFKLIGNSTVINAFKGEYCFFKL